VPLSIPSQFVVPACAARISQAWGRERRYPLVQGQEAMQIPQIWCWVPIAAERDRAVLKQAKAS